MNNLEQQQKNATLTRVAAETRLTGLKALYEAALLSGDTASSGQYRNTIHDCTDVILDAIAEQMFVLRKIYGE